MSEVKTMTSFDKMSKDLESKGIKTPAFGIDLGTTNSAIAVVQAGNTPTIIPMRNGKKTMPSCVMWKGKDRFVVGEEAYSERFKRSVVYSSKRRMGSKVPFVFHYAKKTLSLTAEQVASKILIALVEEISDRYKDVKDVVISVPAYFSTEQTAATIEAGKLAGLNVLSIVREPTAALVAYGLSGAVKDGEKQITLAYDLGGGTYDISLIEIVKEEGSIQYNVIDSDGDVSLGGDDIDKNLLNILIQRMESQGYEASLLSRVEKERLLLRLEIIKKSGVGRYSMPVTMKKAGKLEETSIEVVPTDFFDAAKPVFDRTLQLMRNIVIRSEGKLDDVNTVVLIGGSTKSEVIKQMLKNVLSDIQLVDAWNPDESVALGAAVKAKQDKFGNAGIEIFDVIPRNIGILVADGKVSPIAFQGTRVPFKESKMYDIDDEDAVDAKVHMFEGNSYIPEECSYLGSLVIPIKKEKGVPTIVHVVYEVDSNGLLKCKVVSGGKTKEATLVNLFGSSEVSTSTSSKAALVNRWKRFAETLTAKKAREVEALIEKFLTGELDRKGIQQALRPFMTKAPLVNSRVSTEISTYSKEDFGNQPPIKE